MLRSALVVDDSRVALASLSRMLKGHGLAVDTAESGSEAIDYLRMNLHPSVIFLDHMMPGMDGFETLRALKGDPRTSQVPVVMYTSTEGESYMGQALTAGAIDVLRKPIDPSELMRILHRLKTAPEPEQHVAPSVPRVHPDTHTRPRVSAVNETGARQRSVPAGTTTGSTIDADIIVPARAEDAVHAFNRDKSLIMASQAATWLKRVLYTLLLLLPALWFLQQYRASDQQRAAALEEVAGLKSEAQRAAGADESGQLRDTLASQQRSARQQARTLTSAIAWALNLQGLYDFDQLPLGDERMLQVRELVTRLAVAGFQGTVRIETHVGEFCLVRDEQGAYRLPPRGLPFSRCEVVNHSPEYATLLGRRQSTEFARFLAEPPPAGGTIRIEVVSRGNSEPLAPYPDRSIVQTAGEWNQTARLNNRAEITIIPAP